MRIRVFHTEGFRIAAIFVAIFALSAAALTAVTIVIVNGEFRDQIVQFANADIAAVKDGYRTNGEAEAKEVIGQRMTAPGTSVDLSVLHKGETKTVKLTLGELPNQREANAGDSVSEQKQEIAVATAMVTANC